MKISKPIFIIGTGRSGTTIFHKILSHHPRMAWLSGLCNIFPNKPQVNRLLMKIINYRLISMYIKRIINPGECYKFWEFHCKGFSRPCRDLLPQDVTHKTKNQIQNILSKMLTKKRNRLLIKITGWPRVGFLHEIFNDAKFIHIIRDGRAVVNSLINVDFWWGWRGPQNWRWGELILSQKEEWERFDRSFVALASIEWKILMDAIENVKKFTGKNDFLEVKYEDFCSYPINVFKKVIEFCELEWSREFENSVKRYTLKNMNHKWQKELTNNQQKILQNVLYEYLKKYSYL